MAEIGSFADRRFWPESAIETHSLDGLTSSSRTRKRRALVPNERGRGNVISFGPARAANTGWVGLPTWNQNSSLGTP